MWQEMIVAVCVLAAAAYWMKKLIPWPSKKVRNDQEGCSSCKGCSGRSGGCH